MSRRLTFEEYSDAFVAYNGLGRLPKGATSFARDDGGNAIVARGEKYCRMPALGRRAGFCGAVLSSPRSLNEHLKKIHVMKIAGYSKKQSYIKKEEFASLDLFYRELMKDEEYEGKKGKSGDRQNRNAPSAVSLKRKRPLQTSATSPSSCCDDEDDDEEYLPAKRGSHDLESRSLSRSPSLTITHSGAAMPREKSLELGEDEDADTAKDKRSQQTQSRGTSTAAANALDGQKENREEDEEDLEFELEEARIKGQQLQTQLEMVQLRRKLATIKRQRMQSQN